MADWWQRFGNVSQIASAAGAVIFGIGSLLTAGAVYHLQDQARRDAELGRTADLLMKYQSQLAANQDDFFHGFGCLKYVTSVSARPAFDHIVLKDGDVPVYTLPPEVLDLDRNSPDLARCVSGVEPGKAYQIFSKRFVLLLNLVESALTGWDYYADPEPKAEIAKELRADICLSPITPLFRQGTQQSEALRKKLDSSYPNLTTFLTDECDPPPKM